MCAKMITLETDHVEDYLPCNVERISYLVCDKDTREVLAELSSPAMASALVRLGVAAGARLEIAPSVRATMPTSHFLECQKRLREQWEEESE